MMFYKTVLFLLNGVLMFGSCTKQQTFHRAAVPPQDTTTVVTPVDDSLKTWLALGDSYTIGASVNKVERFPEQSSQLLRGYGVNMAGPEYIATSGWTTFNLQAAIAEQNPKGPYHIVSLLIGVNDQYQLSDTTGYRERFTTLLRKAIDLAGSKLNHVFVISIPDYSVTPFGSGYDTARISLQIDQFNEINAQVSLAYKVNYTNITPATRLGKTDASLIASDGLHPSGKEYGVWAAMLAPKIKGVLSE